MILQPAETGTIVTARLVQGTLQAIKYFLRRRCLMVLQMAPYIGSFVH